MKTLKELQEIREKTFANVNYRKDRQTTRIVVGMATCSIAAGARSVLLAIMDEIDKLGLNDVIVAQTGYLEMCNMEPIVEVYSPDQEKVTYVKMTEDKARRVVREHIADGKIVEEYNACC